MSTGRDGATERVDDALDGHASDEVVALIAMLHEEGARTRPRPSRELSALLRSGRRTSRHSRRRSRSRREPAELVVSSPVRLWRRRARTIVTAVGTELAALSFVGKATVAAAAAGVAGAGVGAAGGLPEPAQLVYDGVVEASTARTVRDAPVVTPASRSEQATVDPQSPGSEDGGGDVTVGADEASRSADQPTGSRAPGAAPTSEQVPADEQTPADDVTVDGGRPEAGDAEGAEGTGGRDRDRHDEDRPSVDDSRGVGPPTEPPAGAVPAAPTDGGPADDGPAGRDHTGVGPPVVPGRPDVVGEGRSTADGAPGGRGANAPGGTDGQTVGRRDTDVDDRATAPTTGQPDGGVDAGDAVAHEGPVAADAADAATTRRSVRDALPSTREELVAERREARTG